MLPEGPVARYKRQNDASDNTIETDQTITQDATTTTEDTETTTADTETTTADTETTTEDTATTTDDTRTTTGMPALTTSQTPTTTIRSMPRLSSTRPTLSSTSSTYSIPAATVPPTSNNPFLQPSHNPSGTVFIAVAGIIGGLFLAVLAWQTAAYCIMRMQVRANEDTDFTEELKPLNVPFEYQDNHNDSQTDRASSERPPRPLAEPGNRASLYYSPMAEVISGAGTSNISGLSQTRPGSRALSVGQRGSVYDGHRSIYDGRPLSFTSRPSNTGYEMDSVYRNS
ncbi:hypothetical protein CANCADRAFT_122336 [Tortispora caseinolytica NRRL Y-17796]|uniref:Mid2 domain-containing protein n=1 Tax=Tortispora caseinolytica NRRL Y-17796 TaxID=767744 RepID=A0A1E4THR3_9ASCO|nr:hypothetical protein CANCADRAFT_122336 [Tortispora caseinolytica NRRL Y-17796]